MNPMKPTLATLLALAVSMAAPASSAGQDDYHFLITGQATFDWSNVTTTSSSVLFPAVECVLCKTGSCSMQASSADRVSFSTPGDPVWDTDPFDGRVGIPSTSAYGAETSDFEVRATVSPLEAAALVQSYACRLEITEENSETGEQTLVAGPTADQHWARPADGTTFTGLLTGTIP